MAFSTTGFGLKPINKIGSNYNTAAVTEYKAFTREGLGNQNFALQMPIMIHRNSGAAPSIIPQQNVNFHIDGAFMGAQFEDKNTSKPVFTDHYSISDVSDASKGGRGNFTGMMSQFITDDPYQLYLIKIDENMTVSAMNGNYKTNVQAGLTSSISSDGKRSIVKLDTSTRDANSSFPLQMVNIGSAPDDVQTSATYGGNAAPSGLSGFLNAGSNVIVRLNSAKYAGPSYGG